MSQTIPASCELGPAYAAQAIGFRILNLDRTTYSAFSTTGVAETAVAGTYAKSGGATAPDAGGYIVWGTSGTDIIEDDILPAVSGFATPSNVSDAQNAITAAIDALNDLDSTAVQSAAAAALVAYDPPTKAELDSAVAPLATQTSVNTLTTYVDTEVAAIKAKTDNLPSDPADASDIAASLTTITGYIDTEVATILAAVDTEIAAIKAVTDSLPDGGALTTLLANVAAILADTGSDGVAIASATINGIADAVLGRSVANVEDTASIYSIAGLILAQFESSAPGTTWTIYKTNGSTTFATRTLTEDATAKPVTGVS